MMNKIAYSLMIGCAALLIGCSTTSRQSDSRVLTNDTAAETQGIGNEQNLVGTDVGPQEGELGTRSFYFAFASNTLQQDDIPIIKAHAHYLLENPSAKVVIEGNTDIRGSREYNIGLGQRRADAVLSIIRMEGVSKAQMRTLSYGAERPVALGHNEDAYRLNRRSDVVYESA